MRRDMVLWQQATFIAAMAMGLGSSLPASRAEDVAEFYRGKQMSLILSAGEGGGYSSYARAFAPFFGARIPGKPAIIVQNMPGGGGLRAMNHLFTNVPKDGTVLGFVHSSVPFAPLYGIKAAQFDPRQLNWLGSLNKTNGICVAWHQSPVKTWEDLFKGTYIVGGTGAGSQMETMPAMINKLFGTKIRIVSGYKGGNDVYLAMERGEVNGRCGGLISSISSTRPDWFPQKKVSIPVQIALERDKRFPDVPALGELTKDEHTRRVLRLILSPDDMDRPFFAPPGVPADRVAALRTAFSAAMRDPGFIAEAARQNLEIQEVTGEEVAKIVDAVFAMPADVVSAAKEALNLTGARAEK